MHLNNALPVYYLWCSTYSFRCKIPFKFIVLIKAVQQYGCFVCEFIVFHLITIAIVRNNTKWQNRSSVFQHTMTFLVDLNANFFEHHFKALSLGFVELRQKFWWQFERKLRRKIFLSKFNYRLLCFLPLTKYSAHFLIIGSWPNVLKVGSNTKHKLK